MKSPAAAVLFLVLLNLVLESDTTDPINTPIPSTVSTPKQESNTRDPNITSTTDDQMPKADAGSFPQQDATTTTTTTTTTNATITAVNTTKTGATSTAVTGNTSIMSTAEINSSKTAAGSTSSSTAPINNTRNKVAIPTMPGNTSTDQTSVANSKGFSDSTEANPILSNSVSKVPNTTKGHNIKLSEGNPDFKGATQETGNTSLGMNDKSVLKDNGGNPTTKPLENDQKLNDMEWSSMKNTGFAVPLSCILVPTLLVVAICLYKMCQKKSPAAENTETKLSAQNKESVKLLSVKSSANDSDLERATPSHHTEFIAEC